jgi:DnaJ family protein A protein 2
MGGAGGVDPGEFFASFFGAAGGGMNFGFDFGAGGAGPSRRRGKGEDTVIPHDVTLDELYNGKTLRLNLEKEAVCGTCKGYACSFSAALACGLIWRRSGARGSAKPKECSMCEGKGWTMAQMSVGLLVAPLLCCFNIPYRPAPT